VYFDSAPDSGYSLDNVAPTVPQWLGVVYNTGSGNALAWDESPEADFGYFPCCRLRRGRSTLVSREIETQSKPERFALYQNAPNPINPISVITHAVSAIRILPTVELLYS
jgi:hypothetical protein